MLKNKFTFINLTLKNTTFYKGVAIFMITMHNFFHMFPPRFGENEQDFDLLRVIMLLKSNQILTKIILFIGSISMYIFYINGFMRDPWIGFAMDYDLWYLSIFICFTFLVIVVSASFLMMHLLNLTSKQFK